MSGGDRGQFLWCAALAVYALGLVIGTHLPRTALESLGPDDGSGLDKLEHLAAYAGLGALAAMVWHRGRPATWAAMAHGLCWLAGFAALDELLQGWPGLGREPDILDFLADLAGGSLGWGAAIATRRGPATRSRSQ